MKSKIKYKDGIISGDKEAIVKGSNKILSDAYNGKFDTSEYVDLSFSSTRLMRKEDIDKLLKTIEDQTKEIKELKDELLSIKVRYER